jgi:hypothetical protein
VDVEGFGTTCRYRPRFIDTTQSISIDIDPARTHI